jgi:hypothetical protein
MKKLLAASLLALAWAGSAQATTVINFTAGGTTTSGGVYQNFDSYASGSTISTNTMVYNASQPYIAVKPAFGSTGNFAAVESNGSYTTTFGPSKIFSFVLGSLDGYNRLILNYADGSSTTLDGGAIIGGIPFASGSNTDPTANGVVTYTVTSGALLSGATFVSLGNNSFEFDSLSAVPEPAAWGMMIMGFGLVGGVLRRRSAAKVNFAY